MARTAYANLLSSRYYKQYIYGVHHFATHNEETKASIVERFNRSLKTRMWRYFTKKQSVRYVDRRGLATSLRSRKCGKVWEYRSTELAIASASAKRSDSSRKVTWQTGPKSCLRSSTRTVQSHRFTAWRTGTANVWRGPSTNPNCRRLLCQKIRRTGYRRYFVGVTREGRRLLNGSVGPRPSTVG